MKMEVGKKYLNERGGVALVNEDDGSPGDRFHVFHEDKNVSIWHFEDGRANIAGDYHLVSEYVEEKSVTKYRVGDKVRIVSGYGSHLKEGIISEIGDEWAFVASELGLPQHTYETIDGYRVFNLHMDLSLIEPYPSTNTLTVGETYTSENGNTWECIAVKGDVAWLASSLKGNSAAYTFKLDGTPICLSVDSRYRITFAPKVETVTAPWTPMMRDDGTWWSRHASTITYNPDHPHNLKITFDLINGTPDWSTAKVSES